MKILYLIDFNINTLGGSQKSTKTIIDEMKNSGHNVGLFMPSGDTVYNNCSYIYTYNNNYSNKFQKFYNKIRNLKKCIKDFDPDIVHPQNPEIAILLLIAIKFKLIDKKRKYVFTDRHFYTEYSKKYKKIWKKYSYLFDYIVTTTDNNKQEWIKNIKPKNIECIQNVLDNDWFEYSGEREKLIKNAYNCNDTVNVGFSGRYVKYKRWDTAFEICNMLNDDKHNFFFTITSDEKNYLEMQEYIEKLKTTLGKKVTIFENADLDKMKEFYYALDLFVLTSDSESFGRTLLEAMTKNNVVLGTNSGGVPNILSKEYLFEVGDSTQAVKMINDIFSNKEKENNEKKNFMLFVKENYSSQILRDKLLKLYDKIMK